MIQLNSDKLKNSVWGIFTIIFILLLSSCGGQRKNREAYCERLQFSRVQQQADSLVVFMKKAKTTNKENKLVWEKKFFCAFPNTFKEMQEMFGYNDAPAPFYNYPQGEEVIQFFSQLKSIPPHLYYNKYIKININGVWEADNIRQAFGLLEALLNDTQQVSKELATFSDSEIKSVLRFIFDGPHPRNQENEALYQKLSEKLKRENPRLSKQLNEAYHQVIETEKYH